MTTFSQHLAGTDAIMYLVIWEAGQSVGTRKKPMLKTYARAVAQAPDYPAPVLIYLSEQKREYLATRGGLKGTQRDDEAHLARVINDLIDRDIERKNA